MRTDRSRLTRGDNRWPLQQDKPSLVWTEWAPGLKSRPPGTSLSGIDGEGGPNLPWQTDLIQDATVPSRCHGTEDETTLYWHQAVDTLIQELKDFRDHWFSILGQRQKKPAITPPRPGMLMDFWKCFHGDPSEPGCFSFLFFPSFLPLKYTETPSLRLVLTCLYSAAWLRCLGCVSVCLVADRKSKLWHVNSHPQWRTYRCYCFVFSPFSFSVDKEASLKWSPLVRSESTFPKI